MCIRDSTKFARKYILKANPSLISAQEQLEHNEELIDDKEVQLNEEQVTSFVETVVDNKVQTEKELKVSRLNLAKIFSVAMGIQPYPFLMFVLYFQTFMLYPGIVTRQQLSSVSPGYTIITLIIIQNPFDTFGRYLQNNKSLRSPRSAMIGVSLRFLFFASFLFIVSKPNLPIIGSDPFIMINAALFGMSSGFFTGVLFILAVEKAEPQVKDLTGRIMGLFLTTGITIGSFLALTIKDVGQ
eukprot:TRINITY_DN5427_c0_g1_i1.p1 TRINITY_DN5427_c0_g1~~TRINITY_DN5427_c0_g1_i1.p1  ORF type:complete len:241 (+),score=28.01 TRINITY_DN5427_c0_g1_i1:64-786(+)